MLDHVDSPFNNPRIISLCSGKRGLEKGLERAIGPVRTVTYVEREAFVIENLILPMECGLLDSAPVWEDVCTFVGAPFHNRIHGIVGGYPCQGESVAGKMLGAKDPRFLWWHFERIIKAVVPIWCYFENVSNHLIHLFSIVLNSLQDMGYRVEVGIYSASEVGAPHQRKRLFILAIKVGDSESHKQCHETSQARIRQKSPGESGSQLGNAYSNGLGVNSGANQTEGSAIKGKTRKQNRQWMRPKSGNPDSKLADSDESGLGGEHFKEIQPETERDSKLMGNSSGQRLEERGRIRKNNQQELQTIERTSEEELANTTFRGSTKLLSESKKTIRKEPFCHGGKRRIDRWPAPPGEFQYDWEASRAVESGLGCTVNGYNAREDLLRMYGNAVVEQQSEFAFLHLLQKHGIEIQHFII